MTELNLWARLADVYVMHCLYARARVSFLSHLHIIAPSQPSRIVFYYSTHAVAITCCINNILCLFIDIFTYK
jgi:hypothetical protein